MKGFDIIVCDLDGTLCDVVHRQHLAQAGAWDEFHSGLVHDSPRAVVLAFLDLIREQDVPLQITFLTGRPETYGPETIDWLAHHCNMYAVDDYSLLMRGKDEFGSDTVVKQRLLEDYLETYYEGSGVTKEEWPSRVLILDDRDKVVAHFRDLGYQCWQVNEGAF